MTRRERREAEERAREEALRAGGRSGDTVIVGGITFHGPAPISPAIGNPVAPPAAVQRAVALPQQPAAMPSRSQHRHMPQPPAARSPQPPAPPRTPQHHAPGGHTAVPAISTRPAAAPRPTPPVDHTPSVIVPAPAAAQSLASAPASAPVLFPRVSPSPAVAAPVAAPVAPAPVEAPAAAAPAPTSHPVAAPEPATRAERAGREPRVDQGEATTGRNRAWLPRVAVLGALAAATIAAPLTPLSPLTRGASPFDLDLAPSGPSTLDVVSARVAAPRVAQGIEAAPVLTRDLGAASRSQDRDPLPGCDASVGTASTNGHLTDAELCDLPFAPGERLSNAAAVALTALNDAYRDEFGMDIALVDSYRTLGDQYSVKESRGYLAARPGTSMHGLGLAIDLAGSVTGNSAAYKWLKANGGAYGWENPPWARRGGMGNYEPWHFEYRPGVEKVETWH